LVFLWGNGLPWTAAPTLFAINSPLQIPISYPKNIL